MNDVPQLPPRSPQPTRSKASSTPTRQSPMRFSSPSKARATPLKTRQTSPRKSPAKSRTFHAMSTQPVSFTPEKTKQPPRAWERRPATPFVPRDDKQKIWKRVPLGEIGIEPNRPTSISRKEQDASKDYVRVVKKLKVGHGSDDEDKENVSAGARVDMEDKDPKRRVRFDPRFVTMRTEEDIILGSPKKKLRSVTEGSGPSPKEEPSEDFKTEEEEKKKKKKKKEDDTECAKEGKAVTTCYQIMDEECGDQDSKGTPDHDKVLLGATSPAAEMIDGLPKADSDNNDATSKQMASDAPCCEMLNADTHGPGDVSNTAVSGHGTDLQTTVADTLQSQALPEQVLNALEHENADPADLYNQQLPVQSMELDNPVHSSDQLTDEMEDDIAERPVQMPEEPRSSSPPTVLAENVIVDELESRDASKLDASVIDQRSLSGNPTEEHDPENTATQEFTSRRVSDDEAAFLRNFVSTSKAERAARDKKLQEMLSDESTGQDEETSYPQADHHGETEELEVMAGVVEETPNLEPPTEAWTENIFSSPLRRSKRAVITSIPRPQTLPNAIQLKRANGNEFIFTANKAPSMVNVAVVTRSNTKRNKGSAMNVSERLEQLQADEEAVANTMEHAQVVGDGDDTSDPRTDGKTETKKRKREMKDGGARAKKVLRWNDEKLVSYQEAERNIDGWEDIDDSREENNTTHDREAGDSEKHVKLTLTMASNSISGTQSSTSSKEPLASLRSSTKDQKEISKSTLNSSQNKLRRVRRGTSGTVNGTPGPKTRSRRVADVEEKDTTMDVPADTNGSLEDSTAATAAISDLAATTEISKTSGSNIAEAGRKSRMPVPVASGLSARRGAAASASVRGTSAVARVAAVTAGTGVGSNEARKATEKETSKSQTQTQASKDDGRGDLLGKRRLRVRP